MACQYITHREEEEHHTLCLQHCVHKSHITFSLFCLPSGSVVTKMRKEHQSQSAPGQGSHTPNLLAPLEHAAPDTPAYNQNGKNPCTAQPDSHRHTQTRWDWKCLWFCNNFILPCQTFQLSSQKSALPSRREPFPTKV